MSGIVLDERTFYDWQTSLGGVIVRQVAKGWAGTGDALMVALRVFASAGFHIGLDVCDTSGISKVTVCWTVHRVVNALNRYVTFVRQADADVTNVGNSVCDGGLSQRNRVHRLHPHSYQWHSSQRTRVREQERVNSINVQTFGRQCMFWTRLLIGIETWMVACLCISFFACGVNSSRWTNGERKWLMRSGELTRQNLSE